MVSPAPDSLPAAPEVGSPAGARTAAILRTYGFHALAVLLGIALAFM
jgi:hypothetical protein